MTKEQPKNKKVLLYSGGLDSFCAAKLWQPNLLLYVKGKQKGMQRELDTIEELNLPVVFEERINWEWLERDDGIIPLRNLYLIALASHYGDRIGMGVLKDEVNGDKSHAFRHAMETVLDICYAPSYWSAGREITVEYPVSNVTKTGLISVYLQAGYDVRQLLRTRSCYAPTEKQCGHCPACIKRHIAMINNGLVEEYENDPHTSPHLAEVVRRWDSYSAERRQETQHAFPELAYLPMGGE